MPPHINHLDNCPYGKYDSQDISPRSEVYFQSLIEPRPDIDLDTVEYVRSSVVSSISRLLDDACTVPDASPSKVTQAVEDMLLSLGIVIADLLAAYFGMAGRGAKFVTWVAHKYLLEFIGRTLG